MIPTRLASDPGLYSTITNVDSQPAMLHLISYFSCFPLGIFKKQNAPFSDRAPWEHSATHENIWSGIGAGPGEMVFCKWMIST
jgi:hypothetical protein